MKTAKGRKLAIHGWPLWKSIPAALALYMPFSAFLLIIPPPFSRAALIMASALMLAGVCGLMWGRWGSSRVSEIAASFIFTSQFLFIGLRAWSAVTSVLWALAVIVIGLFLLAWALPLAMPRLSIWLWREQVAPQTKAGRWFLAISVSILPSVGVVGASAGLFLSRTGQADAGWAVVAVLAVAIAMGWGQYASHQLLSGMGGGRWIK